MTTFDDLLGVQERDTTIDQLNHRRANLPERAQLRDVERRRAELEAQRSTVTATRDEVATRQSDSETEIAAGEKRIGEIDRRMRSGVVTASRDLQAMEHEIESIRQRISMFEDAALEAMEEREPLDKQVADLESAIVALDESAAALRASITDEEVRIAAEVEGEQAARASLAATLPADLLARYERLRTRLGGVGAARLEGDRCTGCHLTLPATEIDRLKREPPDALVYCDQCGRILVRP